MEQARCVSTVRRHPWSITTNRIVSRQVGFYANAKRVTGAPQGSRPAPVCCGDATSPIRASTTRSLSILNAFRRRLQAARREIGRYKAPAKWGSRISARLEK